VSKAWLSVLGLLINTALLSLPLLLVDSPLSALLHQPGLWSIYVLLNIFCLSESYASQQLSYEQTGSVTKPVLPYLTSFIVLFVVWFAIYDSSATTRESLLSLMLGNSLIAVGIAFRLFAIRQLANLFVSHIAVINEHRLVTSGIYSLVRHPSELGLVFICVGLAVVAWSAKAMALTLMLMPFIIYRTRLEDKLLSDKFGAPFLQYCEATPGLLPWLFR